MLFAYGSYLFPYLPGAFRKMPETARNLNWQTKAELAGDHDNLPTMVTFVRNEVG